jgi:hypothetical protein
VRNKIFKWTTEKQKGSFDDNVLNRLGVKSFATLEFDKKRKPVKNLAKLLFPEDEISSDSDSSPGDSISSCESPSPKKVVPSSIQNKQTASATKKACCNKKETNSAPSNGHNEQSKGLIPAK